MSNTAEKEVHAESSEGNAPDEPDFGIPSEPAVSAAGGPTDPTAALAAMEAEKPLEKQKIFSKASLKDLFFGFRSPDKPTRKMTIVFYVSLFALIGLLGSNTKRWYRSHSAKKKAEAALAVEAEKKAPHVLKAKEKELIKLQLNLGEFMLELRPRHEEGGAKVYKKDHMNIANIEIIAECDSVSTCQYLEEHIIQVRDQMILMLTGLEREVLMSREGKQKVKRALIDKLNHWLTERGVLDKTSNKGPIENLYFSRLVLT